MTLKHYSHMFVAVAATVVNLLIFGGVAQASLDLTGGGDGSINGGYFITVDQQSTGTGVIQSFVRMQHTGTEEGYNADARPVMPDVNTSSTFTHDLLLSAVPIVTNPGNATGSFYEFLLDVNQTNANPLISLDALQIYTRGTALSSAGSLTDLTGSGAALRYNLDGAGDTAIILNYTLNSGSGSGDLLAYIPTSAFAGAGANDFVYLYSMFGATNATNDGFEEWAVRKAGPTTNEVVPEPASLALMGLGILGIGFSSRRRRNKLTA